MSMEHEQAARLERLGNTLASIDRIDAEIRAYKILVSSAEKRREEYQRIATTIASELRANGWGANAVTPYGYARVTKARTRVVIRDDGAFERAVRERFGDSVMVTPEPKFSVAEAKKRLEQTPDGDWVFPGGEGEVVPGIVTYHPLPHEFSVTLHPGGFVRDEDENETEEK